MQRDRRTIIDDVISHASVPETAERLVLTTRVTPGLVVFTLFGDSADKFVEHLLEYRAIDQKAAADRVTRDLFGALFKPDARPLFNLFLYFSEKFDLGAFKRQHPRGISEAELEALSSPPGGAYVKREIDGALQVVLSLDRATRPLAGAGSSQAAVPPSGRDYTLVEVKLFTAP
ncbi:MAG: hypothetical protein ACTSU5_01830, partial [Promethearchaeota archaeon]